MDNFVSRMKEIRIGCKYQLICKLGEGTFGYVYLGINFHKRAPVTRKLTSKTGRNVETDAEVAMKLQHHRTWPDFLSIEMQVYESVSGHTGFPQVYWFGEKDDFQIMIFELLGPNLEDVFCYCGNQFSLKTTLMIVDQLLSRFEILHSKQFLHRDIKPENFLLGVGENGNEIYMTDLGLALYDYSSWADPPGSPTSSYSSKSQLIGTCRYASINSHLGICESP